MTDTATSNATTDPNADLETTPYDKLLDIRTDLIRKTQGNGAGALSDADLQRLVRVHVCLRKRSSGPPKTGTPLPRTTDKSPLDLL